MFNVFYLFGEFEELIDFVLVGGEIGREVFDRFIDEVFCYLKLGGVVQIVQSLIMGVEEIFKRLEKVGLIVEVVVKRYIFFEDIVLINVYVKEQCFIL